ncbi:MAG TPA: hypothetical protein VHH73_07080 [Verrucomicrobiae bacterium]|nr:hypothetical protein [Verrucomicrobiae bacterium]
MSFIPSSDLLAALKPRLAELTLPAPFVSAPAFDKVEIFREADVPKAMQELRLFASRLCLLVPDGNEYEPGVEGRVLLTRCHRKLVILLADKQPARPQEASTGSATTPGALLLAELVEDTLTARPVIAEPAYCEILSAEPATITDENSQPGRVAWIIEARIFAGVTKASLTR